MWMKKGWLSYNFRVFFFMLLFFPYFVGTCACIWRNLHVRWPRGVVYSFSGRFGKILQDFPSGIPAFHQAMLSSTTKPIPVVTALISLISFDRNSVRAISMLKFYLLFFPWYIMLVCFFFFFFPFSHSCCSHR